MWEQDYDRAYALYKVRAIQQATLLRTHHPWTPTPR